MSLLLAAALAAGLATAPDPEPPTIPPATIDESLDITGDTLAAQQSRTRMFVTVAVNGQGPFRFLVDSGADRSVIGTGLAARLGLPAGAPVKLNGMAGTAQVPTVRVERLTIGTSTIEGIVAPALPERFLGSAGLLGIDALADQRLLLDFDAKTIIVQDSRVPMPRGNDEIVVTARRRGGQLILTEASVDGRRLYAVIDTGSEITLGNSALRARVFGARSTPGQPITLVSVTGQTIVAELRLLRGIRIGGILLDNVPVAFVDAPPFALFGLARAPALLLGTDLLQSFRRVALDFHARKVRFTLRRR